MAAAIVTAVQFIFLFQRIMENKFLSDTKHSYLLSASMSMPARVVHRKWCWRNATKIEGSEQDRDCGRKE